MQRRFFWPQSLLAVLVALLLMTTTWGAPRKATVSRAKPPKWDKNVTDVFFADAREKLIGQRPEFAKGSAAVASSSIPSGSNGNAPEVSAGSGTWSKLIDPETLEDEIKTLQKLVSENVTTPAKFKGGGFKDGRKQFSELALLFAIIGEYDGNVRWKAQAPGIRDLMARAGYNCKVGTDASYNEAKLRKDDLEQLVQGGTVKVPEAEAAAKWDKVVDRQPLMQRMELAQQQGIAVYTANAGEFNKNAEKLLHEAQLLAAIGEVIQKEGFEFADDETYLGHARQMREKALEVIGAVKGKNYDGARAASGQIDKACSSCHEGFRS